MNLRWYSSRNPFFHWAWLLTFWAIVALISATMLHVKLQAGGQPTNWWTLVGVKLVIWLFWGLITPFIFYTGKRFRVDRKSKFSGLLYHLPASILLTSFNIFLYAAIVVLISSQAPGFEPILNTFATLFFNQFEWYFLIYWGIVLAGYAFEYNERLQQNKIEALQLEARLIKAQLQTLKMQLHPHFLFNTLNTISGQIRFDEKKAAISMLAGLSELLRRALQQSDKQMVPLADEIFFVKQYLDIEKIRFKNKLMVDFDIDSRTEQIQVPSFLLQPVVENAIYHGLARKIDAERLTMKARVLHEQLVIEVYNDGPSLAPNFSLNQTTGIGLSSTLERLGQIYLETASFEINNFETGVRVEITLPLK